MSVHQFEMGMAIVRLNPYSIGMRSVRMVKTLVR